MLCQLAAINKIYLYWVSGHSDILINEMATNFARKGFVISFIGL